MNHNKKKILKVTALFVFMFFLGWGAGSLQKQQMKKTVETVFFSSAVSADEKNSGDSVCPESGR